MTPKFRVRQCAVFAVVAAAVFFVGAVDSRAVVVRGGAAAGQGAPAAGHVGRWNGSSAVAVGSRWALTARHTRGDVGGALLLDGRTFRADAIYRHASADLMLIRTRETMDDWHAITGDASRGDHVAIAGVGRSAGRAIGAASNPAGYDWTGRYAETWGENVIEWTGRGLLGMRFDVGAPALEREAGIAINDSGGGVFTMDGEGNYELVGINASVSQFGRTVHGSWSYAIDLRPHLGWLRGIIGDEADFGLRGGPGGDKDGSNVPAPASAAMMFVIIGAGGMVRRRR